MEKIVQNESTAALREVTVLLTTIGGAGVSGVLLTGGTPAVLKIAPAGGNLVNSANGATLTEITGGVDIGLYALRFGGSDVVTPGDLRAELTPGTGPTFATCRVTVPVVPALRSADISAGAITAITSGLALESDVLAIPTNPLLSSDSRVSHLDANISSIPTNPLLTSDSRLNHLDANISSVAAAVWDIIASGHRIGGSFGELAQLIAGALHINVAIDNTTFDSGGLMLSARLRVFSSAAAASSAVPGHADNEDGEIFRLPMTALAASPGRLGSFCFTRVL